MSRYATKTAVPVDRSMAEVRGILLKNNAQAVAIAESLDAASVQFIFENHPYKFIIKYPTFRDHQIQYTKSGKARTETQMHKEINDEHKRLWRAMVLYIKAAIEAHQSGLVNLKKSLMGNLVLSDGSGQTVYQRLERDIEKIRANPTLLIQ